MQADFTTSLSVAVPDMALTGHVIKIQHCNYPFSAFTIAVSLTDISAHVITVRHLNCDALSEAVVAVSLTGLQGHVIS